MPVPLTTLLSAGAALAGVLGLILLAARLVRRAGLSLRPAGAPARLALGEALALDARRRLHLVRCEGRELLLLTGGPQDLLLGWLPPDPTRRAPAGEVTARVEDPPGAGGAAGEDRARPVPARRSCGAAGRGRAGRLFGGAAVLALLLVPALAHAQALSIDLGASSGAGAGAGATGRLVQLTALITVLSLAPSLLVMVTAFTRIVIVLSLLRSALATQGTPPNIVLIGLALFLTFFVMQPVLAQAWASGLLPMSKGQLDTMTGLARAAAPFRHFMLANLRPADLRLFLDIAHLKPPATPDQTPWRALIPAFMVGELRRGFEIGFLLFLPFLVIDMVVASVLMSLGMMMLPPSVVSLPFKLIFFVLIDGWGLVAGSLVRSFRG